MKNCTKKIFMTRIVTMVVIPHLEPDILQTGDGIPVELFQILKDDAVKVLHSICKFGKLSSDLRTGKGQFSF